jgi:hypothetical protein
VGTGAEVTAIDLPALRAVGKDLSISYLNRVQIISAPHLANITGTLRIDTLPALHALSLPALGIAGAIQIQGNASLGELSLPVLSQVRGEIWVLDTPLTALDLSALAYSGEIYLRGLAVAEVSLPQLEICERLSVFENHTTSFSAPHLAYVNGDLGIGLDPSLARLELPSLELVKGRLSLRDMPLLAGLDLPLLEQVGDQVAIWNNAALERLSVPKLRQVHGDLAIDTNPVLASLAGLAALQSIDGTFYFQNNRVLEDLSQLSALGVVTGSLQIGNTQLGHLGLPSLTRIGRDLVVGHINLGLTNPRLESIDLPALREVDRLVVSQDARLTGLALPALRAVWSALEVWDAPLLRRCVLDALVAGLDVAPHLVSLHGVDETATCE